MYEILLLYPMSANVMSCQLCGISLGVLMCSACVKPEKRKYNDTIIYWSFIVYDTSARLQCSAHEGGAR